MAYRRTPVGYNGTRATNRELRHLLPLALERIGDLCDLRPDLILVEWPKIIGEKLSGMTKAVSFENGLLNVRVNSAILYSDLQRERGRLLKSLRDRFPSVEIKNIVFRVGKLG